jgi:hypothetical protein
VLAHADRRVVSAIIAAAAFATPTPQSNGGAASAQARGRRGRHRPVVDAVLLELLSAMILSSGRPRPSDAERFLRRVTAIMVCY